MNVDLETVRRVIRDVLDQRMSRESADRWAHGVIQESEADSLTYSPTDARDRIWEGIMYLYGIDMMEPLAVTCTPTTIFDMPWPSNSAMRAGGRSIGRLDREAVSPDRQALLEKAVSEPVDQGHRGALS